MIVPALTEHAEQSELIRWTREAETLRDYPEVELLFAIPNGAKLPYKGKGRRRYSKEAVNLKREGLKPGVPDLCLPVPAGVYNGLFIEMKSLRKGAKASDEQLWWFKMLTAQGFKCVVCRGFEAARDEIKNYLSLSEGSRSQ